jgi:hypothetical protein
MMSTLPIRLSEVMVTVTRVPGRNRLLATTLVRSSRLALGWNVWPHEVPPRHTTVTVAGDGSWLAVSELNVLAPLP